MNIDVGFECDKSQFEVLKSLSWTAANGTNENNEETTSAQMSQSDDIPNVSQCHVDTNYDGVVFCPVIDLNRIVDYSTSNFNLLKQKKEKLTFYTRAQY